MNRFFYWHLPPQKNQTPFTLFIFFKRILLFLFMGRILDFLYGKLRGPLYNGCVLISPAIVAGNYVVSPKAILT